MNIKRDIVLPLIQRDVNYPNCLIIKTTKKDWETYTEKVPTLESFSGVINLEICYIGNGITQAEQWLDTKEWELLGVDIISGRPALEIL